MGVISGHMSYAHVPSHRKKLLVHNTDQLQ